ncbi:sialidase [Acrasis kona]|uniref:Sialidase n=1 Tax=Acrasis kona TaxID=1008807 RepID=A0AAW2Z946_9EUKA
MGNSVNITLRNNTSYKVRLTDSEIFSGYSSIINTKPVQPKSGEAVLIFTCEPRIWDTFKSDWYHAKFQFLIYSDENKQKYQFSIKVKFNDEVKSGSEIYIEPFLDESNRSFPFIYSEAIGVDPVTYKFILEEAQDITMKQSNSTLILSPEDRSLWTMTSDVPVMSSYNEEGTENDEIEDALSDDQSQETS